MLNLVIHDRLHLRERQDRKLEELQHPGAYGVRQASREAARAAVAASPVGEGLGAVTDLRALAQVVGDVALTAVGGKRTMQTMAKNTQTFITDDMDGSADAAQISFSYKGTEYTIDLAEKNEGKLDKALAPYIKNATKVSARQARSFKSSTKGRGDLAEVRTWAAEQGIEVSDRGRVSKAVLDQYDAAH